MNIRQSLTPQEACEILLSFPYRHRTEILPIPEALERILAEDITASIAMPSFDKSPFDGYALRSADTSCASLSAPVPLKITEEIPAGACPYFPLKPLEAAKILTGAPLPEGADCIVKFEDTQFTATKVTITKPLCSGQNVIRTGEEYPAGTLLLSAGSRISPAGIGIMASQGITHCLVYQKPSVSIINTGSELTTPGTPLAPGKIYNSSHYVLEAGLKNLGFRISHTAVVPDDVTVIASQICDAMEYSDLVITTGGASVGDYDFAVAAAQAAGAQILFWKTRIKPGSCFLAAVKEGKLLLSLSGNPGAALTSLLTVALPCLRMLCGCRQVFSKTMELPLKKPVTKKSPVTRYLRGHLSIDGSTACFEENDGQGNGMISAFMGCNLVGEIPAGSGCVPAGTKIRVYDCSDFHL